MIVTVLESLIMPNELIYSRLIYFTGVSVQVLQVLSRTLQRCFTVKLQKRFVGTSADFNINMRGGDNENVDFGG